MNKIKLSLIIPVYNVEKYIGKCIDSILSQDAPSEFYEVIFVIDGSKDNSEAIIRKKLKEVKTNKNIKVLTKENGGLSSARNYGITYSVGQYLWFIDSDDWIESNSVSIILKIIKQGNLDIIAQTVYFQELPEHTKIFQRYNHSKYVDGPTFCNINHSTAAQFYVINKHYWNSLNLKFYLGILHEDAELTPRMLYSAEKIFILNKPLYHILKREGSITQTINPKRCYDYMIVINNLYSFYSQKVSPQHKTIFAKILTRHILGFMDISIKMDKKTQNDVNNYIKQCNYFKEVLLNTHNLKYILLAIIFKIPFYTPLLKYKLLKL